jgi:hypothetical protein
MKQAYTMMHGQKNITHYILFTNPYSHVIILSVNENSNPEAPLFLMHKIYIFLITCFSATVQTYKWKLEHVVYKIFVFNMKCYMAGSDLVKVVTHNVTRWRHTHTPRDHYPTADARHTPRDHVAGPQHTHNDKTTAS